MACTVLNNININIISANFNGSGFYVTSVIPELTKTIGLNSFIYNILEW